MVKNLVLRGIKMCGRHFGSDGHTNRIAYALPEWTGGTLNAWGLTVFRMSGCFAVKFTEVLYLFEWEIIPGEVQPAIKEHTAMTSGENKTIAVEPLIVRWIDF